MKGLLKVAIMTFVVGGFGVKLGFAEGYLLANVGGGGQVHALSGGGEVGKIWKSISLGFGGSAAAVGWTEPRAPGAWFVKEHSDEYEFYGALGIRLASRLYLVATAGASGQDHSSTLVVGGVHDEGWDNEPTARVAGSGQLRYVFKRLVLGAGYHNRRGVLGTIGFTF